MSGDRILGTGEFLHFFASPEAVIEEIRAAGFRVVERDDEEQALFIKDSHSYV